jgi:hypothetical protein
MSQNERVAEKSVRLLLGGPVSIGFGRRFPAHP